MMLAALLAVAAQDGRQLPRPGELFDVQGHTAFVIEPEEPSSGSSNGPQPWVWYAPTLPRYPAAEEGWMIDRLLAAGVAVAGVDVGESYGSPTGRALYQALYEELTSARGYAASPVLLARSRGGLMLYSWAAEHPDSVAGIAGIYPVCDLTQWPGDLARVAPAYDLSVDALAATLADHNPIERLAPLAAAGVPILHVHGDQDRVVTLEANSAELARRYAALGGEAEVLVIEGRGHDLWEGWFRQEALVAFMVEHATRPPTSPRTTARQWPQVLLGALLLLALWRALRRRYAAPMTRARARHILVHSEAECLDLKAKLEGGGEFESLAKQHSACPSGQRGGDLGEFGPGQMVAEFDQVVFNDEVGVVHGPVKTQFGFHLLEVTSRG